MDGLTATHCYNMNVSNDKDYDYTNDDDDVGGNRINEDMQKWE